MRGKRKFIKRRSWGSEGVLIEDTEFVLGVPLQKQVANRCKTGNPVVVEWGCGRGHSIADLARNNPRAKLYGFSKESYREWNKLLNKDPKNAKKQNTNLKFIHAEADDFFRYFKDNSIDIMFSKLGLCHLANFSQYLREVVPKLKVGGIIITDTPTLASGYHNLIGFSKSKTKKRKQPFFELDKKGFYAVEVEAYTLPTYTVEYAHNGTVLIRRTK